MSKIKDKIKKIINHEIEELKAKIRKEIEALKCYLSEKDYRNIASEMGNYSPGTVRQIAQGNRWNAEVAGMLIRKGLQNKANLTELAATADELATKRGSTSNEPTSTGKTPENAPATNKPKRTRPSRAKNITADTVGKSAEPANASQQ